MIDPAAYAKDTESSQQIALFAHIAQLTAFHMGRKTGAMASLLFTPEQVRLLGLLFHVPNGGNRDASVGGALKAEGVKAGVPDLFLPVPAIHPASPEYGCEGEYHGLWIEMKRPATATQRAGTVSPQQAKWHADLIGQGYCVCVCYTWLEAVEVLWKYLNGRLTQEETKP